MGLVSEFAPNQFVQCQNPWPQVLGNHLHRPVEDAKHIRNCLILHYNPQYKERESKKVKSIYTPVRNKENNNNNNTNSSQK